MYDAKRCTPAAPSLCSGSDVTLTSGEAGVVALNPTSVRWHRQLVVSGF